MPLSSGTGTIQRLQRKRGGRPRKLIASAVYSPRATHRFALIMRPALWPLAWVTLALLVCFSLAGCVGPGAASTSGLAGSGSSADTQIDLSVSPNPPVVGPAQLTVTLKDAAGNPINDATVSIEGDMTHAGMVPVQAGATGTGNGVYVAKDFNFDMGGDWVVTVSATTPSGDKTQRLFNFNGVSANGSMGTMTMGTMTPGMNMATPSPTMKMNGDMNAMGTPTPKP